MLTSTVQLTFAPPTLFKEFFAYIYVVGSVPEVVRNFTWAVLGMEDGNFSHLGGVNRWNSQFLIHIGTFLAIIYVAS